MLKPMRSLEHVVTAATDPKVLHRRLNERRGSSDVRMQRYRTNDCDEDGKKFMSIEVMPHFL